ncbi:ester cyclase [Natrinema sp. CBA1119]|uniref:ester cyclase n=1 Tax=Natrinema sp. CBA1119 TaxID=1608465 RepID=UPI00159BC15D|nr:ester cyclase [Natrinema sp. CBA1119]
MTTIEEIHGVNGYVEYLEQLLKAFPDLTVAFEEMVAEGDTVVVRYSSVGTHEGVYSGVEPAGKQVTISGLRLIRVEDGKITDVWSRANNLSPLGQLGVVDLSTE